MKNNLTKIVKEAKKIRKDHPHMEWKNALKEAGQHLRNAVKPVVHVAKKSAKKHIKRGLISLAKSKHLEGLEGWHKGSTLFVEKNEIPKRVSRQHPTLVVNRQKKKRGTHKKGTFKHFIQIGALPAYKDPHMAREIQLYADNDGLLYQQKRKPILINLSKKYIKGTYDVDKASKLWRYYIDSALQKYHKEFGGRGKWYNLMDVPDRNLLAHEYALSTLEEFKLGNLYA